VAYNTIDVRVAARAMAAGMWERFDTNLRGDRDEFINNNEQHWSAPATRAMQALAEADRLKPMPNDQLHTYAEEVLGKDVALGKTIPKGML
jgi:hypothetical protein